EGEDAAVVVAGHRHRERAGEPFADVGLGPGAGLEGRAAVLDALVVDARDRGRVGGGGAPGDHRTTLSGSCFDGAPGNVVVLSSSRRFFSTAVSRKTCA